MIHEKNWRRVWEKKKKRKKREKKTMLVTL